MLRVRARELVTHFEQSVRGRDMKSVQETVDTLISDASLFTPAVPPLLESYCSRNPVIHDISSQMLSQRAHWIDRADFNEFFIPCVNTHLSRTQDRRGAMDFLYGVSRVSPVVEEQHLGAIFELARDTFRSPGSGEPLLEHAILSLFGERMPEVDRHVVFQCSAYVLSEMLATVKAGKLPERMPPDSLTHSGLAGLLELASLWKKEGGGDSEIQSSFSSLVWGAREFVDQCVARVENGTLPEEFGIYMLLLEYPYIDPEIHFPSREAMLYISELLREDEPQIGRMILDSLSPAPEKFDFAELSNAIAISSDSIHQLRLFSLLNKFVHSLDEGEFKPANRSEADEIAIELDTLEKLTKPTLMAFHIQRAQRALARYVSEQGSNSSE